MIERSPVQASTPASAGSLHPLLRQMGGSLDGGGVRGGPFHSQSPEGWFVGEPGLKVVCPGTVGDAYGLLRSAIEDDDPVLFFEHKALYRRLRDELPGRDHRVPLGVAATGGSRWASG